MGYCFDITDSEFTIESVHYPDLMDHLIKFHTKAKAQNTQFKWVDNDKCLESLEVGDLIGYFQHWSYDARIELSTGNITRIEATCEKLGEEDKLWEQIAPWVNDGSYIQCHGEDSAYWRWAFREGKFFFVEAQLHWDDPIDCGYRYQDPNICGDEVAAARRAVGWDGGLALEQLVLGTEDIVVRTEENEHGTQYAIQALRTKGTT